MVECFLERHMPVGRDGGKEGKAYICRADSLVGEMPDWLL